MRSRSFRSGSGGGGFAFGTAHGVEVRSLVAVEMPRRRIGNKSRFELFQKINRLTKKRAVVVAFEQSSRRRNLPEQSPVAAAHDSTETQCGSKVEECYCKLSIILNTRRHRNAKLSSFPRMFLCSNQWHTQKLGMFRLYCVCSKNTCRKYYDLDPEIEGPTSMYVPVDRFCLKI